MEAEIIEIEGKLRNCKIIKENVKGNKVQIGSSVTILDLSDNEQYSYKIVGTHESDPLNNKISNESPLGKAVLDRSEGDECLVKTPKHEYKVRIVRIGEEKGKK